MDQYIVLVDDEEGILKALKRELADWARPREVGIVTFTSGEEALRFLGQNHLDVVMVISDQRMPGLKGYELLDHCNQRYPGIILLMLTGYTDIQDITRAIRSGITSFILKPWEHDDLIYEVTKAYNLYETRVRNRRYLKLIKNEISLAAAMREQVAQGGDYDYRWCRVGTYFDAAAEQTQRGVDTFQHMPLGQDRLLLLAVHADTDGVRGSMVAGALLLKLFAAVHKTGADGPPELSTLFGELTGVLSVIERELPTVFMRYTLALVERENGAIQFTGFGYPPWLVIREGESREIDPFENAPGEIQSDRLHPGDLIAIASPGVIAAGEGVAGPSVMERVERHLRSNRDEPSLSRRAEVVLQGTGAPAEPTDLTLMLVEIL